MMPLQGGKIKFFSDYNGIIVRKFQEHQGMLQGRYDGLSTMKLNSCIQTTVIIINCDIFIFIFVFLFLLHMTFTSFKLFYQRDKTLKILSKIS